MDMEEDKKSLQYYNPEGFRALTDMRMASAMLILHIV